MKGQRHDQFVGLAVGVAKDLGWGWAVLHRDDTVSRICKGCFVVATTAIGPGHKVVEAEIHHRAGCPVIDRLGNDPTRS